MSDLGEYAKKARRREKVWNIANLYFQNNNFNSRDIYEKIDDTGPSITPQNIGLCIRSMIKGGLFLLVENDRRAKSYRIPEHLKGLSYRQALRKS